MRLKVINKAEQRIRDQLGHSSICGSVSKWRGKYITTARKCTCYAQDKHNKEETKIPNMKRKTFVENYANKITTTDTFETISKIPDNFFQAIITDPPYDLDLDQQKFLHKQFLRICNGIIIVFSPPKNQWIQPADQYLFWIKQPSTKNTSKSYSRFVEMIFVYGRNRWNYRRHWSNYINVFPDLVDDAKLHPFRKPPSLITRLITNHTDPNDWIFDPFTGSGLVCEIADEYGRNFVGFEIDDQYKHLWSV